MNDVAQMPVRLALGGCCAGSHFGCGGARGRAGAAAAAGRDGSDRQADAAACLGSCSSASCCGQSTRACEEFFRRYFDDRGYLECVERWGGDDGPDDAIENVNDWPVLYALGAPIRSCTMFKKAWEGHLRQYTAARTREVPFARDGMYYKEFPVMFDWLHKGEGLSVFNLEGLCDPAGRPVPAAGHAVRRVLLERRSRRAQLRPEAQDHPQPVQRQPRAPAPQGDGARLGRRPDRGREPVPARSRGAQLRANARTFQGLQRHRRRLAHESERDHSGAQCLHAHPRRALQAMDPRVRRRLARADACQRRDHSLQYRPRRQDRRRLRRQMVRRRLRLGVHASSTRATKRPVASQHITTWRSTDSATPTFSTGDDRFLDAWRKQIDAVNSHSRQENGRTVYPHMYGDQGWYDYRSEPYQHGVLELYYWSMKDEDRRRVGELGLAVVSGGRATPDYPEAALRGEFATIRRKVEAMRRDTTTPDTRLADDPMAFNPATVGALVQLMLGGLPPKHQGEILHARVRYFDPVGRRPGLPEDVAALVDSTHGPLDLARPGQLESDGAP